jgi:valacyclovir hydrolase
MTLNVVEQGAGDAVLVMPGFTDNIEAMKALRDHLATDYRVIAVDLPGSGRSGPQPRSYPPTYYEDDADTMAALLKERGVSSARIVGHSDGGEVALLMAARHPTLVRSVIAIGTLGEIPTPATIDLLGKIIDAPAAALEAYSKTLIAYYGRETALATTKSWARASHEIAARGGSIARDIAGSIACPVLLVVGEKDLFIPSDGVRALAARIASSEVIVVPGAGHNPQVSKVEWFNAMATEWFAKH